MFSHRKSNDDHVKVLSFTEDAHPIAADITEDALAIRIPNAPGDEDNFVIGLGIDLTCTGVEVSHPTDVTAPDLPPQPVLMVRVFYLFFLWRIFAAFYFTFFYYR